MPMLPYNNSTGPAFGGATFGGIADYLQRFGGGGGLGSYQRSGVGLGNPYASTGTTPRAMPSPINAPITPGGLTKEGMGQTPFSTSAPGMAARSALDSRRFDPSSAMGLNLAPRTAALEPTSHIRYSTPSSGGMQDYNPDRGIEAFAGGQFLDADEGTPGGGGYAPSQQDWSKVSNPMAFEAYTDPIRQAQLSAERVKAERSVADPLWEERGRADIWRETQQALQVGIQQALQQDFERRAQDIERKATAIMDPVQRKAFVDMQMEMLNSQYENIYGTRGSAGSTRSYGSPDLDAGR